MKRHVALFAAAIAVFALSSQTADAHWRHKKVDQRVATVGLGAAIVSTLAYFSINDWHWKWNSANNTAGMSAAQAYGLVSIGCAAASPIVATAVIQRPLTTREAHVLVGSCFVPVVGGLLVNAAFDAHPEWEGTPVKAVKAKKKKK